MAAVLTEFYPWTKALHVISVIAWMAGFLYLPRLFVYHAEAPTGSNRAEMLKVMERRLLRAIMNPSLVAVLVFGGLLVATPGVIDWTRGWWHVKLASVLVLVGMHMALAAWRKDFEADRNQRPARFYRIVNEVPAVIMVVIVVMVIVRPF